MGKGCFRTSEEEVDVGVVVDEDDDGGIEDGILKSESPCSMLAAPGEPDEGINLARWRSYMAAAATAAAEGNDKVEKGDDAEKAAEGCCRALAALEDAPAAIAAAERDARRQR